MGFNPRLAPYSASLNFIVPLATATTIQTYNVDLFRFPFAGQLLNAYGQVSQATPGGTAIPTAIAADTTTFAELALWKATDADTTATYATAKRAAIRTGVGAGFDWALSSTSGSSGLYALTNKSATRREFAAGDRVLVHLNVQAATNANRTFQVTAQMDYVIGLEAGATPSAGTGPA